MELYSKVVLLLAYGVLVLEPSYCCHCFCLRVPVLLLSWSWLDQWGPPQDRAHRTTRAQPMPPTEHSDFCKGISSWLPCISTFLCQILGQFTVCSLSICLFLSQFYNIIAIIYLITSLYLLIRSKLQVPPVLKENLQVILGCIHHNECLYKMI